MLYFEMPCCMGDFLHACRKRQFISHLMAGLQEAILHFSVPKEVLALFSWNLSTFLATNSVVQIFALLLCGVAQCSRAQE